MFFDYNAEKTRKDFPILEKPIVYFDNACMSLKPIQVIDKINEYYKEYTACAGRSAHRFASRVEEEVDKSRNEVRKFINAGSAKEIIFTRNTTEGINLVANCLEFENGDNIIISDKEHNSNLIPWLKLSKKGIKVLIVATKEDGTLDMEDLKSKIDEKTKLVSIVFTSNVDGVVNPIKEIAKICRKNGSLVLVDGAQAAPSMNIDVKSLDVDFLAFSGHKMLGPTGTGILYGKEKALENLPQFIVGGETVTDSTHESYNMEELPMRFEAGLQDYAGIIGLGEACKYLKRIGMDHISKHEIKLNEIITEKLISNPRISVLGPKEAKKRSGIFSFNIKGMNALDISKMLDVSKGIMTRAGMHCVHSWFNKRRINGSVRASLYLYNTEEECNLFVNEVEKILRM